MEHKTTTVTFNEWRYNEPGETHDEVYTVGDEVVGRIYNNGRLTGKISGRIKEIFICQRRNIYSLQVESGWCIHPERGDEVEIVKPYQPPVES